MRTDLQPKVPVNLSPYARELLERLREEPSAKAFVLGGGVALSHYCEYRQTFDVDAWWRGEPEAEAWESATRIMRELAAQHGLDYLERGWEETRSSEWRSGSNKVFSFQVSRRTVNLDPSLASAWSPVRIETFRDNLAAKMNALVVRGAPRDILDVFELCQRNLVSPSECWELWRLKNANGDPEAARGEVLRHLAALEGRRPLEKIANPGQRARAAEVRAFVRNLFCKT